MSLEGGFERENDLDDGRIRLHYQFGVDESPIGHEFQWKSGDEITRNVVIAPIRPLHLYILKDFISLLQILVGVLLQLPFLPAGKLALQVGQ